MAINLISKIKPKNNGAFPMYEDVDVEGGFQTRNSTIDRDTIPTLNRKEGMVVYTRTDGYFYQLNSDLTTWTHIFVGTGGGNSGFNPDPTSQYVKLAENFANGVIIGNPLTIRNIDLQVWGNSSVNGGDFSITNGGDGYLPGAQFIASGSIVNLTASFVTVNNGTFTVSTGLSTLAGIKNTAGMIRHVRTVISSGNILTTDDIIKVGTLTGSIALTLPSSPTQNYEFKFLSGVLAFNVTISGNGNNIMGTSDYVLSTDYESVTLTWTGSEWSVS